MTIYDAMARNVEQLAAEIGRAILIRLRAEQSATADASHAEYAAGYVAGLEQAQHILLTNIKEID